MATTLQQLQELLDDVEPAMVELLDSLKGALEDADKFDQGNDTGGVRVRKVLLDARKRIGPLRKKLAEADTHLHEVRGSILEIRKSRSR